MKIWDWIKGALIGLAGPGIALLLLAAGLYMLVRDAFASGDENYIAAVVLVIILPICGVIGMAKLNKEHPKLVTFICIAMTVVGFWLMGTGH